MPAVRPARPADVPALADIHAYYVRETVATFDLTPPSHEEWARRYEDSERAGQPWWVAEEDDGTVAGSVITRSFRPKDAWDPTVEISAYLHAGSTGQGWGTRLYEVALPELSSRRFHRAIAGIALPNAASVALHERHGFVPVGVFDEVGHKHGAWRSVGWWIKAL